MKTIGTKIKEIRKRKGFSQEELAELSGVSLRTIQRIENNQNEPHGKTIQLICEALEVRADEILDFGKQEKPDYFIYLHLSVLAFIILPLGNIIFPLILWLSKRDRILNLDKVGASVLNFQILWTILFHASMGLFFSNKILGWKISAFNYFIVLIPTLYLINIIFPIIYAVRAKKGKFEPTYPKLIKFIV